MTPGAEPTHSIDIPDMMTVNTVVERILTALDCETTENIPTDHPHGSAFILYKRVDGKLYGTHIIEVHYGVPLGADRGFKRSQGHREQFPLRANLYLAEDPGKKALEDAINGYAGQ